MNILKNIYSSTIWYRGYNHVSFPSHLSPLEWPITYRILAIRAINFWLHFYKFDLITWLFNLYWFCMNNYSPRFAQYACSQILAFMFRHGDYTEACSLFFPLSQPTTKWEHLCLQFHGVNQPQNGNISLWDKWPQKSYIRLYADNIITLVKNKFYK